jgi:hypothetical protein
MRQTKVINCFIWFISGISVAAQPVLQAEAYGPVSMNLYSMVAAPNAIAANGPNVVWDISAYPMNHFGTMERIPAEGTPYASAFPGADWAEFVQQFNEVEGYSYYNHTDSLLELMGFAPYWPSSDPAYYVEPLFQLMFPFSFGEEVVGTGQFQTGVPNYSIWRYTAFGTLITSVGIYPNVVKLEDLANPGASSFWTTDPIVNVLDYGNWTFFNIALPIAPTGLQPDVMPSTSMLMVTGHTLTIPTEEPVQYYRILDTTGRMVAYSSRSSSLNPAIDVSHLGAGCYVLQYQTGGRVSSQRFQR